jgi:hypothetical protein
MLTAKTGPYTGRYSGLYIPVPRGRHVFDNFMIESVHFLSVRSYAFAFTITGMHCAQLLAGIAERGVEVEGRAMLM